MKHLMRALACTALVCLVSLPARAGLLEMPSTWQVLSRYNDPVTGQEQLMTWSYAVNKHGKGPVLTVSEREGQADVRYEARLGTAGRMKSLTQTRRVGRQVKVRDEAGAEQGPQIFTRSMIPLSLLHEPDQPDSAYPKSVSEIVQAAGAGFSFTYLLTRQSVPLKEALEQGLVGPEQVPMIRDEQVLIYSLTKQDGSEVLRQTWAPSLPFWLLEIAPNRTSWLQPF